MHASAQATTPVDGPSTSAPPSQASLFGKPIVLAALMVVALAGFFAPGTQLADVVQHLRLPDNDDAMRLVGVRDLLAGQGWLDNVQHRHLPLIAASSWSRFVDAPIAMLVAGLTAVFGQRLAEGLAAALWPSLLFLAYLALTFTAARRSFGLRAACLAVFAGCQTAILMALFQYGRIDHHNVQILCALGIGVAMADRADSWRPPVAAGALAAFSLAVGLEALPLVASAGLFYAARWMIFGRTSAPSLAGFAGALAIVAPVLFGLQTAPHLWGVPACDALSAPWLLITTGAGLTSLVALRFRTLLPSPAHRAVAVFLAGGAMVALFAAAFPVCLGGPFAGLPQSVKTGWLETVQEAKPIFAHLGSDPAAALAMFAPLLIAAVLASHQAIAGSEPGSRRAFAAFAALLWPGVIISLFQIRGVYVASAFVPLVAGWALDRAIGLLRAPGAGSLRRGGAILVGLLLLSKTWWLLALGPAKAFEFRTATERVAVDQDATEARWTACTDPAGFRSLDRLTRGVILSQSNLGANLLLHTHHSILAAPYHRHVEGLVAEIEAFGGSEADAKRHADLHRADYIVICPRWLDEGPNGREAFLTRLSKGEAKAAWLEPLAMEDGGALQAWRVLRP